MKKEKKKNDNMKLIIYGGFIIFILIFTRISNFNTNTKEVKETNNKENDPILLLNNIDKDYHELEIYYYSDDDVATYNYEKYKDDYVYELSYHGKEINYIYYNKNYYLIDNDKITSYNYQGIPFDNTFTNLENIISLFNLDGDTYNNENYKKIINTCNALSLYNRINESNLSCNIDNNIEIYMYFEDNEIDYIKLDLTNLYNIINSTNYNKYIYEIELETIEEDDISSIEEYIS